MAAIQYVKRPDAVIFGAFTAAAILAALAAAMFWWTLSQSSATENLLQDLKLLRAELAEDGPEFLLAPKPAPPEPALSSRQLAQEELTASGVTADAASLISAAAGGDEMTATLLLTAGMDPNVADDIGTTPLIASAAAGKMQLADLLIGAGAQVEDANVLGKTALMAAAAAGHLSIVKLLVAADAEINARDANGHGALHYAINGRRAATVSFLIKKGADPNTVCCSGKNSLIHALETRNYRISRSMLKLQPQPLAWNSATIEAVLVAIRARDSQMLELLMGAHGDSLRLEGRAQTLLSYAVAWNDFEAVKLLLGAGEDPNTVLSLPADEHFAGLIDSKKVKYYLQNEQNMTLLMLAAALGRTEIVAELLERGARRGAVTARHKMAAVSFAAQQNHVPVMQLLLGKKPGADETRIEISLSNQRAVLYRHGTPALTTRISTGRGGYRTPTGSFVVTDKHRVRRSSLYRVDMPFFMRLSCSEYGMHEGVVPNYPASHGCIRIPRGIARTIYKFVDVGTLVNITN